MKKVHIISGSCYHIEGTKKQIDDVKKTAEKRIGNLKEEKKQTYFMYGLITVTVAAEMGLKIQWR